MIKSFLAILLFLPSIIPGFCFADTNVTSASLTIADETLRELALSDEWLKLVHYKRNTIGQLISEADGKNFFLSSNGKTDPELELKATLAAFSDPRKRKLEGVPMELSAQCQFPARWDFLNRKIQLSQSLKREFCADFETYKKTLSAKSVHVVFSAYHIYNPSSAYGHSFLRISKSKHGSSVDSNDLLDTGLSYSASSGASNPLAYVIKGLSGGFKGYFTTLPYFYKVREYNDFESRDLWEYELNLSDDERDQLVAHSWELASTYFDYYYLTENCSYHMLTILEAAAPRLHLSARLPFYVIPADTLKIVASVPGLVARKFFRPSLQTKFSARATLLSPQKKLRLKQWISNDSLENPVATASSEDVDTVDAYLDFVDLSLADQIHKKDSEALAFKEQVLLSRIRLPTTPPFKFDVDLSDAPDKSHGSARARTRISQSRKLGTTLELAHRFALHDLLDIAKGLPETSQLVFFDLSARVGIDRPSLALSDFTLLDVAVRNPIDAFQQKPSWSLAIGATRVLDERCIDCVVGGINSNFGYTFKVFRSNRIWFYGLVGPAFELSSGFEAFAHLLVAPTAGIRFKINSATIALLESRFKLGLLTKFEDLQTTATLRSSLQAWFAEVRFETSRYEDRAAAGFGLYY